jgi:hypothetical protein
VTPTCSPTCTPGTARRSTDARFGAMVATAPVRMTLEGASGALEAVGVRDARVWWFEPELRGVGVAIGFVRDTPGGPLAMTAHVVVVRPHVIRAAGFEVGWPVADW